jgi:hypothetical protein
MGSRLLPAQPADQPQPLPLPQPQPWPLASPRPLSPAKDCLTQQLLLRACHHVRDVVVRVTEYGGVSWTRNPMPDSPSPWLPADLPDRAARGMDGNQASPRLWCRHRTLAQAYWHQLCWGCH